MNISDFDFELPAENIACHPAAKRDQSRLMVLNRKQKTIEHRKFFEILKFLNTGDALVLNNSKVIPARLFGHKKNGGALIEFLLIEQIDKTKWKALTRPSKRLREGDIVEISENFSAQIGEESAPGERIITFQTEKDLMAVLHEIGHMPLPPYIVKARRDFEKIESREKVDQPEDHIRYQTVYAKEDGSVAAPTAGLHFTEELLQQAKENGIEVIECTLHVGPGTFKPVAVDKIEDHVMHTERFSIDKQAIKKIKQCKKRKGRLVSVGTTSVRTLETIALKSDLEAVEMGSTNILLSPGSEFKLTDVLITNFHLPRSTLLMLVAAFADHEFIMKAYAEAIKKNYRFYSYGDAMLII